MGCGSSSNSKGKKKNNKKRGKNSKGGGDDDDKKKKTPEAMKKELTETYKQYKEEKRRIEPYLAEKFGLGAVLNEEREKLLVLLSKKDLLIEKREPLMTYTWEKDADDIHRAFSKFSADKAVLIGILMTRTKWQLLLIAEIFEKKYGNSLLEQVINDMTTLLGR